MNKMREGMLYRNKIFNMLFFYAKGVEQYWVILLFLSLVYMGLELVMPVLYKAFINNIIIEMDIGKLKGIVMAYILFWGGGVAISYAITRVEYIFTTTTTFHVKERILSNYYRLKYPDNDTVDIGDLKMRIEDDTELVGEMLIKQTIDLLLQFISIAVSSIMLFFISAKLTVITILAIPITLWLDNFFGGREKLIIDKRRENEQKTLSWLHNHIQGWREIKALNLDKYVTKRYGDFLHIDMIFNSKWINYWTTRVLVVPKIKNDFLMKFVLYLLGGGMIISGELYIGELLIFAIYYKLLSDSIQMVSAKNAYMKSKVTCIDRLIESLNLYQENETKTIESIIPNYTNIIEISNVSFSYLNSNKIIFTNLDVIIRRGERVAIVGKSGSGKTTFLKILAGTIIPDTGNVLFSGVELRKADIDAIRKKIGYVMQENILFHTTIKENLYYGKEDATEEELIEACKKACIYDFILSLADGFNTIIGEKGIKLSGGQRQRIVLARMFLQDVDIYLLDEATSGLDEYNLNLVQDALRNIGKDKTVVIATHRESVIHSCNRVIRIEDL